MPEITEQELEGKSLEEIRAMEQAAIAAGDPAADTRQRDDKGRFVAQNGEIDNSADPNADPDPDPEDPEEFIFTREIDLGDGSGKQVFTGKGVSKEEALEDLTDKLAQAQTHATRKIKELTKSIKAQPEEKRYTEEEEFIISQELMSKPTEGFKKLFKETTGFDIKDFKTKLERVDAFEAAQRSERTQQDFLQTHQDFIANPDNAKKLAKQCQLNGEQEFTAEGLHKAYLELKESGLLELRTEGADADTKQTADTKERIVPSQTDATQQRSRRSSTVISRGRTAPIKTEPTEDELYSMPLDKLRDLANAKLAEQS